MGTIRITAADDPRVADYLQVRDGDLAKRRGLFLAEGAEVVRTLVKSARFRVRSLFLAESRAEAMQDVLQAAGEVPIYLAPQAVMDRVAGFPIHRGCLAAGERGEEARAERLVEQLPEARTMVVLEAIANHDNVGGLFRNALAFGAAAVLLDERCADPLYRKAIRVSMGATLRVPYARGGDLVALLKSRGFACCALTPRDATPIGAISWPERVALFFGTEGEGLSAATVAACDLRAMIPMAPGVDSVNVATASGIALFTASSRE